MVMKIEAVKVKVDKVKKYEITYFDGVIFKKYLPKEYLEKGVRCYVESPSTPTTTYGIRVIATYTVKSLNFDILLRVGQSYNKRAFERAMNLMKESGERLARINNNWSGKRVIKI